MSYVKLYPGRAGSSNASSALLLLLLSTDDVSDDDGYRSLGEARRRCPGFLALRGSRHGRQSSPAETKLRFLLRKADQQATVAG
jgi:hypothetical protein